MKKTRFAAVILSCLLLNVFSSPAQSATFEGKIDDWRGKPAEKFSDPEATFKLVMKKIRENYIDRGVTEEELYRAATAGMLAALNSGKESENWNMLLSPRMLEDFVIEKSGKLSGIGVTLDFDEKSGNANVLMVIPGSAALKAGLKKDDQILSVNGIRYKGKGLGEMASEIRGPIGKVVHLKVLRGDRVLSFAVTRDIVKLPGLEAEMLEPATGLLTIGSFTGDTPSAVNQKLKELAPKNLKKLIIDLRGNGGGTFDDAVKVGEIFLPKGKIVTRTQDRGGKIKDYVASGKPWHAEVQLIVLTDKDTSSGAELLASALHNGRNAMTIGQTTRGKWNVQSLENLPNKFAIKYSVLKFETEDGKSYQETGMKPDLEIDGPKGAVLGELRGETDLKKRVSQDPPLKAAMDVSASRS